MKRWEEQESYDEPRVRPQSTPAWNNGKLCTLGYSGLLKCFDAANGKLLWEYDLVKTFGATPVQFGFSSSPLVYGEWFVVGVGGKQASVITFRAKDGAIVWKSEAAEPSYASPIVLNVGGDTQIVQVNRDNILGISAKDGSTRWRYPMPKPGLTNVPTPIALSDGKLLVSGQGLAATRLLQIVEQAGRYTVTERWKNTKAIFFYCNWVVDNTAVYGCVGDFIGALDLSDGKILWDERGFANANLLHLGGETAILRGDGQIAFCRLVPEKFAPRAGKAVLSGRCWTPPTATGDTLLVRDDKEIAAVRLIPAAKSE
jgi:outer membrane protein assembly factor BamB